MMSEQEQRLLFTIAKILQRRLALETDYGALQDLNVLDDAIDNFRNYIPFQQAP